MKGIILLILCVNLSSYSHGLISPKFKIPEAVKKALNYPEDYFLTFEQNVQKSGYNVSAYTITSEDGYIMKQFRVNSPNCSTLRPIPVFLMHGLFLNSDLWLASRKDSLTYLMADSCFDVWVGNNRGNNYGRNHVTLNPNKNASFWDFSIDEIGYYDIPEIIDLILDKTGAKKVNYIAYSQGSAVVAITQILRPEYIDKINVNINLGPAIRVSNMKSIALRFLFNIFGSLYNVLTKIGWVELFPKNGILSTFYQLLCHDYSVTSPVCNIISSILDYNNKNSSAITTLESFPNCFLVGVSAKLISHYNQIILSNKFSQYNYGSKQNIVKYGTQEAPEYDLSKAKSKALVILGLQDHLAVPEDVNWFVNQLPDAELFTVNDPKWCHIDMSLSQHVPALMYPKILQFMTTNV